MTNLADGHILSCAFSVVAKLRIGLLIAQFGYEFRPYGLTLAFCTYRAEQTYSEIFNEERFKIAQT